MKNLFKKAVSLTIAASTVATLSVSAFAATATYYAEETKVDDVTYAAESVVLEDYAVVEGATQYAVAVVPVGFTGGDADIYYVNQYDPATIVGVVEMLLKDGLLEDGEYEVRIGNNAAGTTTYDTVAITVYKDEEEVTILYGDVFKDGAVTAKDKLYLGRYLANWGGVYDTDCDLEAADVFKDGSITAKDKLYLGRHLANWGGDYSTLPVIP